jgi:hypothetical protein
VTAGEALVAIQDQARSFPPAVFAPNDANFSMSACGVTFDEIRQALLEGRDCQPTGSSWFVRGGALGVVVTIGEDGRLWIESVTR